jgi:hypothetical protein
MDQEAQLLDIRSRSPTLVDRKVKAFANFQHNARGGAYTGDRLEAIERIPKDLVFYAPKMPRAQTWSAMAEYAFCASPHGHGLDCHRTWEALALGCIPIVKKSPLDDLYSKYPIWIVSDWSEVTLDGMVAKLGTLQSCPVEQLSMDRWISRIRQTAAAI